MGSKREVHRMASAAWATLREDLPRANTLNRLIDWVVSPSKSAPRAKPATLHRNRHTAPPQTIR